MIIGLSGRMFEATHVWEHIDAASRYGYRCLALRSTQIHPGISSDQLIKIKEHIDGAGLSVLALLSGTGNFALLREQDCPAALNEFARYAELAELFGAELLRVWPGWISSAMATEEQFDRAVRWTREAADIAASHGLKVTLDTHIGTLLDSAESALRFIEAVGKDNVGLMLEPANLYVAGAPLTPGDIARLAPHVFCVSARDMVKLNNSATPGSFYSDSYVDRIERFTHAEPPEGRGDIFVERRVLQGSVDWFGIVSALTQAGYDGALLADSAGGYLMPTRAALARLCRTDLRELTEGSYRSPVNWLCLSPAEEGMHTIVAPEISDCRSIWIYRLNIPRGITYKLMTGPQEMNAVITKGSVRVETIDFLETLKVKDSFYLPGRYKAELFAEEDSVLFIGAALCEGYGSPYFRQFEENLNDPEIYGVFGAGAARCDVFYTVGPKTAASRLICGITTAEDGQWSDWPPHQHERDMEEAYCYFDLAEDRFGLHLSYLSSGGVDDVTAHTVRNNTVVLAPRGYHSTVSVPSSRNTYFWVLAAHSHNSRKEELFHIDPLFGERIEEE